MSNIKTTNQDMSTQFMDTQYLKNALMVANEFYKAGCFSGNIQNAHQAFVIIQAGAEMGMKPMESINSFYIVNGKITIYGPAQIKLLKKHGWRVSFPVSDKSKVTCRVEKGDEIYEESYSINDLPSNSKAKGFAPQEKLRYHAVSRILRFNLPEVMDAGNFYTQDEVENFQDKPTFTEAEIEDKKSPVLTFITEVAESIDQLETVKDKLTTEKEIEAYKTRETELFEKEITPEEDIISFEEELESIQI